MAQLLNSQAEFILTFAQFMVDRLGFDEVHRNGNLISVFGYGLDLNFVKNRNVPLNKAIRFTTDESSMVYLTDRNGATSSLGTFAEYYAENARIFGHLPGFPVKEVK